MKNIAIISVMIVITFVSNYIGHIRPPFSISWTPVLIGVFTALILYYMNFSNAVKFSLIVGLIILNDVLVKLYAGGTHDWEGVGWITAFLFLGLAISLLLILIYGFTKMKNQRINYFLYLFISSIILFWYIFYFYSLGMSWVLSPTSSIEASKEKGLFISKIKLSENEFVINQLDTIRFKSGWVEKQIGFNHQDVIKQKEITDNFNYMLFLEGNFDMFNNSIYYKIKDTGSIGYYFLEEKISFSFNKYQNPCVILFYNNEREIVAEIEIILDSLDL